MGQFADLFDEEKPTQQRAAMNLRFGIEAQPDVAARDQALARRFGADVTYTEMVKAYPLVRGGQSERRPRELLQTGGAEPAPGPGVATPGYRPNPCRPPRLARSLVVPLPLSASRLVIND